MSIYPYDNDYELTQSLGRRIVLKRLRSVQALEDVVLHDSRWWMVTGYIYPETGVGLELEIAGPSDPSKPETSRLFGNEDSLTVTAPDQMGLQFVDGVLQDVPWPGLDLIHIRDARARGLGSDPSERVHGVFILRYEKGGDPYYAPADREFQPGVASSWVLQPGRDLILDWEPIDMANLLEWLESGHD